MNVLFFALSTKGFGETLIGLNVSRALARIGVKSHFVIDERSEMLLKGSEIPYTVIDAAMGPFVQIMINEAVLREKPQVIILADSFTYEQTMAYQYFAEPWAIEHYNIPIVPIDIWEWAHTTLKVDIFGDQFMESSAKILNMPAYLRPVPLCHVSPPNGTKSYPFSLRTGNEGVTRRTREHLRTVLTLGKEDKLILLAVAPWQTPRDDAYPQGQRVARGVPRLLFHYLSQLPSNVHVVSVGQPFESSFEFPKERLHHIPACAPHRFNLLLDSVDVFLTLNMGATTLARATIGGTQSLALVNSYEVNSKDDTEAIEQSLGFPMTESVRAWLEEYAPLYKFRMWPLGFYDFLTPLLEKNPYLETFPQVELLDAIGIHETLNRALFDADYRDRFASARRAYVESIDKLGPTEDVFVQMVDALGA